MQTRLGETRHFKGDAGIIIEADAEIIDGVSFDRIRMTEGHLKGETKLVRMTGFTRGDIEAATARKA